MTRGALSKSVESLTPTTAALVELAQAGDRHAFEVLIDRYRGLVYSIAFSLTRSSVEAEEMAQDAFVTAWTGLAELRESHRFRNWICSITRNSCLDSLGFQKTRWGERGDPDVRPRGRRPSSGAATDIPSAEPSPLDRAISLEEEKVLREALACI